MKQLQRLEEVVRKLVQIDPPIEGLAALGADQALLRRLPPEYYEAANSLLHRTRKGGSEKTPVLMRPWI